ncbi:hypothetical protein OH77DRAFT_1424378 [Trametes cingulata]|nr:hypothetical protein OH77DRAFT_1424378 [Trametes cingulata]
MPAYDNELSEKTWEDLKPEGPSDHSDAPPTSSQPDSALGRRSVIPNTTATAPSPDMSGSIIVANASPKPFCVFVSSFSQSTLAAPEVEQWHTLEPGARASWARSGWELVAFRTPRDVDRAGVYVKANSLVVLYSLARITVT